MTAVAEQPVESGLRGRVPGRESRRGARTLPPAMLPDVQVVLPAGQQMRPDAVSWPQTEASRNQVAAQMLEIAGQAGGSLALHRMSLRRLLDWLESQPGSTWQQRWNASGAEQAGRDWAAPLTGSGRRGGGTSDQDVIKAGMMLLLAGQVIRPGLEWVLDQPYYKTLAVAFKQIDPAGLEALQRGVTARGAGGSFATARNIIARIMICKGGPVTAVTAGDCAWYWHTRRERGKKMNEGGLFYTLLFEMGVFGQDAPPNLTAVTRRGQLSCAELIDRYQIEYGPVRDLLVDYLAVRRPAVDYTSLESLARNLGLLFWRDLELHHPGIGSLHLPPETAAAWKLRLQTISHDPRRAGQQRKVPENTLMHVRAFYADLASWAAEDPVRWGRFAAPCPVRASEITFTKIRRHRKAAMDQRTRTLAPVLPALVRQTRADLDLARQRLQAARQVRDGQEFTAGGQTWRRHDAVTGSGRIYGIGAYRDLSPAEWDEFLGHFELRKVELGVCTRDFGTPCVHEHACIRCPALRPDPGQRHRLEDILASLRARLAEARQQGWAGETAGLEVSIAAAEQKLHAMVQLADRHQVTHLGMPDFRPAAGRSSSTGSRP